MWERLPGEMPDGMKTNPLVRSSFFWALRHGDRKTKLQVIQALGMIADNEVKEALQAMLMEPDEDDDAQKNGPLRAAIYRSGDRIAGRA